MLLAVSGLNESCLLWNLVCVCVCVCVMCAGVAVHWCVQVDMCRLPLGELGVVSCL